jgi:hypothetical protein
MKKLIVLFSGVLFAFTITNTKTYYKNIPTSTLKANLEITVSQKNLENLIKLLNINVKKLKSICENISYSFTPVYNYTDKKEFFENYKAYINAECLVKTAKINKLSKLIKNLQQAKVKLTYLNFALTDNEQKSLLESLKTEAYTDIQKEAETFSKKLNKKCFVSNIRIFTPYKNRPGIYAAKAYSSMPLPQTNKKLSIKADYKIECY